MSEKPYYLAGPMTGFPQFNFPLFHDAASRLRAVGYSIVSPAEMDSPAVRAAAVASTTGKLDDQGKIAGETWGEILARDVQVVADKVQGLIFLPEWSKSRGARLEAFTALLCGHKFGMYTGGNPLVSWVPDAAVQAGIVGAWK
jgi:hypothetical protein